MGLLLATPRKGRAAVCVHCGSPLGNSAAEGGFCCPGCSYVHRLISEQGHATFYKLRDRVTAPADSAVFQPRSYDWLAERQRDAEARPGDGPSLRLEIQGLSCAACVWLIERVSMQSPGVRHVRVDAPTGSLDIAWTKGAFDAGQWARTIQSFGYLVGPAGTEPERLESSGLARRAGLCGAFTLNVMLFTLPAYFGMPEQFQFGPLFRILSLAFATLSALVGGGYFISRSFAALRAGSIHIDLPIAIGIAGAYLGSLGGWLYGNQGLVYFDFVATFTFLMLVGRWAQVRAVERNRRRLLSQQPAAAGVATVNGARVPRQSVKAGDVLLIASGETLPVDGILEGAAAVVSLASISGEGDPRPMPEGSRLCSGSVNVGRSDVRVRALQAWDESILARLTERKPDEGARPRRLEKLAGAYVAGIVAASVAAGAFWLISSGSPSRAAGVALAVLVVSCPCAVGLALPLADEMAVTAARNRGVYVREASLWGRLAGIRKIVFDKTGTLTLEAPSLDNPQALRNLGNEERSALAGLVRDTLHPVSQCLWESLQVLGRTKPMPGTVEEIPGLGVRLGPWTLGRAGWAGTSASGAGTVLAFAGQEISRFQFTDAARPNTAQEVERLGRDGYLVYILSGDSAGKVASMAARVGVPAVNVYADQTALQKAEWMGRNDKGDTLMLGDGANDSLAFDRAHCRGTPMVHRGILESKADFYYLRRGVEGIRELLAINRARRATQAAVIAVSVSYNVAAVALAAAGHVTPIVAAVLMPASSLLSLAVVAAGMSSALRRPRPEAPGKPTRSADQKAIHAFPRRASLGYSGTQE